MSLLSFQSDARDLQKRAVLRMLKLCLTDDELERSQRISASGSGSAQTPSWKCLVYDSSGQAIIAPLFKWGTLLGNFGITLHKHIDHERGEIPDTPCVYFLDPNESNIDRLIKDCEKRLYPEMYINFTSSVSRGLLERLASGLVQAGCLTGDGSNPGQPLCRVNQVVDRYVHFVALGPQQITLNLDRSYKTLCSMTTVMDEQTIFNLVDKVVQRLLSVIVTLKLGLPIIRCDGDAQSPSRLVAEKLHSALHELSQKSQSGGELFNSNGHGSSSIMGGGGLGGISTRGEPRPLLALLDRDIDISTMLAHTWTYQSMCHDILGMKLNKITVKEDGGGGSSEKSPNNTSTGNSSSDKIYDIDPSDKFWTEYQSCLIHDQFEAVAARNAEFTEQNKKLQTTSDLSAAMSSVPEMQEKKRSLETHTNIGHALLAQIQKRSLDRFYQLEDEFFASNSISSTFTELETVFFNEAKNSNNYEDRARSLMILYLRGGLQDSQLEQLKALLGRACYGQYFGALGYVRAVTTRQQQKQQALQQSQMSNNSSTNTGLPLNQLSNTFTAASALTGTIQQNVNTLSGTIQQNVGVDVAANIGSIFGAAADVAVRKLKQVLPHKKELPACAIVSGLMDNGVSTSSGGGGANVVGNSVVPNSVTGGPGGSTNISALGIAAQERYLYLDPMNAPSVSGNNNGTNNPMVAKFRGQFRRCIVCMVGGGSYSEAQALKEKGAEQGREIVYTTTNFANPEEFLTELDELGKELNLDGK